MSIQRLVFEIRKVGDNPLRNSKIWPCGKRSSVMHGNHARVDTGPYIAYGETNGTGITQIHLAVFAKNFVPPLATEKQYGRHFIMNFLVHR
jgi:hypothetical protein